MLRPYKTVKAASLVAVDGDLIRVATGTYNEEDIVFATGVSLHGETVKALINANITFGSVDALDHSPISIRDITFGKKSAPKVFAINYTSEIVNCNFYGPVTFGNANRSATVIGVNYRVDNANPAVTFSGTMYSQVLGKVVTGQVVFNSVMVSSKSSVTTIGMSGGTLNVMGSQIANTNGGKAIDAANQANSASALMCSIISGNVDFGVKPVLVNGIKMMSGTFAGTVVRPDDDNLPTA